MVEKNCPDPIGRFIKVGDPIRDVVTISDFSLVEICQYPIAYPDNAVGNVIHSGLHEQAQIDASIRESEELKKPLNKEALRPVLKPLDFTDEWTRQRQRFGNRNRGYDEEDELELELEYLKKKASNDPKDEAENKQDDSKSAKPESTLGSEQEQPNSPSPATQQTMDEVGNAINAVASAQIPDLSDMSAPAPITEHQPDPQQAFDPQAPDSTILDQPIQEPAIHHETPEPIYPDAPLEPQIDPSSQPYQEAVNQGYQEGLQRGVEEGKAQAQEELQEMSGHLQNIAKQLDTLKKDILVNAQENFQVLCQALMESIMDKEFEINPDSLSNVIKKAVDEAVDSDEYKIHVNSETLEKLKTVATPDIIERLVADESLNLNDFKIESNLSAIDGRVAQLIKDQLNQVDINLFETKEKAG